MLNISCSHYSAFTVYDRDHGLTYHISLWGNISAQPAVGQLRAHSIHQDRQHLLDNRPISLRGDQRRHCRSSNIPHMPNDVVVRGFVNAPTPHSREVPIRTCTSPSNDIRPCHAQPPATARANTVHRILDAVLAVVSHPNQAQSRPPALASRARNKPQPPISNNKSSLGGKGHRRLPGRRRKHIRHRLGRASRCA